MYYFCTYFDSHFLTRGLALYESLRLHCPSFRLFILCMDDKCYKILSRLNLVQAEPIQLEDFEKGDKELLAAKNNRSRIEYYFTCTPSLPLYILNHYQEIEIITYLDADLFFFSDPYPLYHEFSDYSVSIIPHRFPPHLRYKEKHGKYNVGYLSFRRDQNGLTCLQWWREQCIEWCYDHFENGRYADQKYLDEWPKRFQDVLEIKHKGANLAPWNIANYCLKFNKNDIVIDEYPLIFFHFHGFKQLFHRLYDPNLSVYKVRLNKDILLGIYLPYIRTLSEVARLYFQSQDHQLQGIRDQIKVPFLNRFLTTIDKSVCMLRMVITGNYIYLQNEKVK